MFLSVIPIASSVMSPTTVIIEDYYEARNCLSLTDEPRYRVLELILAVKKLIYAVFESIEDDITFDQLANQMC